MKRCHERNAFQGKNKQRSYLRLLTKLPSHTLHVKKKEEICFGAKTVMKSDDGYDQYLECVCSV